MTARSRPAPDIRVGDGPQGRSGPWSPRPEYQGWKGCGGGCLASLSPSPLLAADRARPLTWRTSPRERGDSPMFIPVLVGLRIRRRGPGRPRSRPDRVRGDKAYSSRNNRACLRPRGIKATIPQPDDQPPAQRAGRRASTGLRQGPIPPPQCCRAVRQQVEAVPGGGQQIRQARPHLQRHPGRCSDRHLAPRHRPRAIRNDLAVLTTSVVDGDGDAGSVLKIA